ncbi:MAG: hypothetical protein WD690_12325 [Vicinamibacterales bacterium]
MLHSRRSATSPLTVAAVCILSAALAGESRDGQQDDSQLLADLLQSAGRYVQEYERSFSAVVAREYYVQRAQDGGTVTARELRSEVALVGASDEDWLFFRDVHEVDGRAIRGQLDRLTALFLKPVADLRSRAVLIAEESARYNLGDITRTINTPTQALAFLRPEVQPRSRFRLGGLETISGMTARELSFQETAMPRMILTRDDAAASGRFWVVPDTGAIVRTELQLDSADASAFIRVTYAPAPGLALSVPVTMTESYELARRPRTTGRDFGQGELPSKLTIDGRATYTEFRRFEVKTHIR